MARILAIDYGKKRTGIAVTDENQLIAGPLATVETSKLMNFIREYLSLEKVECVVIGEPRQMNNEESQSAEMINTFVKNLSKTFPEIIIERIDERFTSKIASRTILESGIGKMKRRDKSLVDKVSAVVMLQDYLLTKSLKR